MNIKAKQKPGVAIAIVTVVIFGILYFMPGTQVWGPFATVSSVNYDTCNPYELGSKTNLASNYLESPLSAGDCGCGMFSCTPNVTCTSNGAGSDCQKDGLTSQTIARVSTDSKNGATTLELLGRRANSCLSKAITVEVGKTYTLSFWFKHVQGASNPFYCIWRTGSGSLQSDCEPSKSFLSQSGSWYNDTNWHYYQEPFTVPTGTQSMGLYFYASGGEGEGADSITINRYSDIRLVEGDIGCSTGSTTSENSILAFLTTTVFPIGDFNVTWWMIIAVVLIVLFFVVKK